MPSPQISSVLLTALQNLAIAETDLATANQLKAEADNRLKFASEKYAARQKDVADAYKDLGNAVTGK